MEEIASLFGELVTSNGQRHVVCDYDKNHSRGGDAVVLTAADNSKDGQANEDLVDSDGSNDEEAQGRDDDLSDIELLLGLVD